MAGSTVPQLVMPSLTVPGRRSFSDVGKSMGRLRLLVAGRAGIGKTSLIQALGQNCQHIVHMDPLESCSAGKIREIYASTRPDPWWRASSEPVAYAKRRRQSLTHDILDRNLCFLDCPALPNNTEASQADRYVQTQLLRLCERPIEDEDLFHLLSGGAGPIVHVVLYMVPFTGPNPADIRCIKSLQKITNVIPLLARADELACEDLALSKDRLVNMLSDQGLEWFSFARPESAQNTSSIYAVSSTTEADCRATDASIHMSFEILQSQVSTDLEELIDRIFSLDGSSRLRYSAALKSVLDPKRGFDMPLAKTGPYTGLGQEQTNAEPVNANHQDPLGLLELGSRIKHGGRLTLELMSSLGVFGCIAMWLIRPEIARHWDAGLPPSWCLIRF
ncbi:septin domain-containing protein [Hirsutella rhossiliensis]|uniref:Septin domain-containing protein n=1 Tax=Hirsutella rhossiliensis TaxID=111463 RepID=A0A9P8SH14_9HYPO|nr:septin domain-containing protein [Hirsutella rhossiliensis]KAH0960531.1 septin domain-containing protein [Hirsutella rhossiliensis]